VPASAAVASSFYPAFERLPAGEQPVALGLSTANLILLILGAFTVVLIGVFLRRLAEPTRRQGIGG
jgi:hypothetical protein